MNAPLTLHRDPTQSSAMSAPIWRRIPDELMSEDEVQDLCDYADRVGAAQGYEDAQADRFRCTDINPFDVERHNGVPALVWAMAYRRAFYQWGTAKGASLNLPPLSIAAASVAG